LDGCLIFVANLRFRFCEDELEAKSLGCRGFESIYNEKEPPVLVI